jgi:hypothetical protein
MGKQSKTQSLVLHVLLIASAVQAITPDTYSVASARLIQVLDPIVGFGMSWVVPYFGCRDLAVLTPEAAPDAGSLPNRDNDQEDAPDEVCVPTCALAFQQVRRKSGEGSHDTSKHRSTTHRQPAIRLMAARRPTRIVWTGGLFDALFRFTC